jgi:mRNA interferase RelE/StbE
MSGSPSRVFGPLAENRRRLAKPLRDDLEGFHAARRGELSRHLQDRRDRYAIEIVHIDRRSDVCR